MRTNCSRCGEVRDGSHASYCRRCDRERKKTPQARETRRRWDAVNSERRQDYLLRWNYGIGLDEFNLLWENQQGQCCICGRELVRTQREKLSVKVDHDHSTGVVRGLLCQGCNIGLGQFEDCPERLEKAANYLRTVNV